MNTDWNFDAEVVKSSLENASSKAADLISAAQEKLQEIEDAKAAMEDAQSDLDEAISTLETLPNILMKYEDSIVGLENVDVYY